MFEPKDLDSIRAAIQRQTARDSPLLQTLRADVREHLCDSQVVRPHAATTVSLVASDGGNNSLRFDPFAMQLVRVVDSNGGQLLLDVISPTSDPDELVRAHHQQEDALSVLLGDLDIERLHELSPMFPTSRSVLREPERVNPRWPQHYRDLAEWAVLYQRVTRAQWGSDTLLVRDGLLRSAIFRGQPLARMRELLLSAIDRRRAEGIKLFLVGVAKHSQVLTRYRLAMALEEALPAGAPRYVRVPRALERKTYRWVQYTQGAESHEHEQAATAEDAANSLGLALGTMFLVRFGQHAHDQVWPVDLLSSQLQEAGQILGYLLADAQSGFPVPWYPRCLQRAHEHAQVVGFDLDVLQDAVFDGCRELVEAERRDVLEGLALAPDVTARRYSSASRSARSYS